MIEALIINHLNAGLTGVQAHALIPHNKPRTFVVIERTGGSIDNLIKQGMFVADCFAPSVLEAAQLCENVIELMMSLTDHNEIASVRLNSHYNDTDTALHEYKYGALFEITYY